MAAITAPAIPENTRRPRKWRRDRTREALAAAGRQGTAMVSAARHHNWSPALTIGGLASGVTSAWTTFGLGAGLLALAGAFFAFDWSRD